MKTTLKYIAPESHVIRCNTEGQLMATSWELTDETGDEYDFGTRAREDRQDWDAPTTSNNLFDQAW